MRLFHSLTLAAATVVAASTSFVSAGEAGPSSPTQLKARGFGSVAIDFGRRDASTVTSGGTNNEGEDHDTIVAPKGSMFTTLPVGSKGETVAAYWTANPQNNSAQQAFIMIHGRLRDGDSYWKTMNNVLKNAVEDNVPGASKNSIVTAPQFFSTIFNSGQYDKETLAWGDVNAWQAGDIATHPTGTTLTSFDALDAMVDEFQDASKYPNMKNITVVGHGGGGQLMQRYAAVGKTSTGKAHVRYIHGDPSSCAYFTEDRPKVCDGQTLPKKSSCGLYNTWRYGFDNFTGTADGLKTPQQYFQQYITRDVVSIVGYQDVESSGDQYCMAVMQGGDKRRDRNLAWWQYINTLARTNEDIQGFPATFSSSIPDWSSISHNTIATRLVVIEDASHSADEVFSSSEGEAVLFSAGTLPTGWRPDGWKAAAPQSQSKSTYGGSSTNSSSSSTAANAQHDTTSTKTSGAASLNVVSKFSLLVAGACSAAFAMSM